MEEWDLGPLPGCLTLRLPLEPAGSMDVIFGLDDNNFIIQSGESVFGGVNVRVLVPRSIVVSLTYLGLARVAWMRCRAECFRTL